MHACLHNWVHCSTCGAGGKRGRRHPNVVSTGRALATVTVALCMLGVRRRRRWGRPVKLPLWRFCCALSHAVHLCPILLAPPAALASLPWRRRVHAVPKRWSACERTSRFLGTICCPMPVYAREFPCAHASLPLVATGGRYGRFRQNHAHTAHQRAPAVHQAPRLHHQHGPCRAARAVWRKHRHPGHGTGHGLEAWLAGPVHRRTLCRGRQGA